jgi:hypothetical protein
LKEFEPIGDPIARRLREQALIEQYGGPKGGQLLNKINSISKNNVLYEQVEFYR